MTQIEFDLRNVLFEFGFVQTFMRCILKHGNVEAIVLYNKVQFFVAGTKAKTVSTVDELRSLKDWIALELI